MSKLKLHIILVLALWLAFSGVAAAEQFYVNESGWWRDGGTFNASTVPIQAAVGAAGEGDAIYVEGGIYDENVDVDKPRLTLEGEGANVVTVTAADPGDHVFEVTQDYVNISGFAVRGATDSEMAGVYLGNADYCNISGNNVYGNSNGIYLWYSSNNTLTNNIANSNNLFGIYLSSSSNNTLTNNTADSNSVYGIYLYSSSNNTLTNNIASNNYYGIYHYNADDNNITCNLMRTNTKCGFSISGGSIGNNINYNNIIENGNYNATSGGWGWQFYMGQYQPVEAKHNYWGAGMNRSTIDASIYDTEGGWGEVEFYPFEIEPVPCAPVPKRPAFTTADAVIALHIAVGSCPPDPRWDVSGDGSVTSLDALMILQAVGG